MEEDVIDEKDYVSTYSGAMDSITALDAGPGEFTNPSDWEGIKTANLEHLILMLEEDWPEEFDLTPINEAIAAHQD